MKPIIVLSGLLGIILLVIVVCICCQQVAYKSIEYQRIRESAIVQEYYILAYSDPNFVSPNNKWLQDNHAKVLSPTNEYNRGAEILAAILPLEGWLCDSDGDGLEEVCNSYGNPLVFLNKGLKSEKIMFSSGECVNAIAPPNIDEGDFYICFIDNHGWSEGAEEVVKKHLDNK